MLDGGFLTGVLRIAHFPSLSHSSVWSTLLKEVVRPPSRWSISTVNISHSLASLRFTWKVPLGWADRKCPWWDRNVNLPSFCFSTLNISQTWKWGRFHSRLPFGWAEVGWELATGWNMCEGWWIFCTFNWWFISFQLSHISHHSVAADYRNLTYAIWSLGNILTAYPIDINFQIWIQLFQNPRQIQMCIEMVVYQALNCSHGNPSIWFS